MKFLIAVPSFDTKVDIDCFKSIYNLDKPYEADITLDFVTGYDCARARNKIAERALSEGFDYVFMVDSDMVLPQNALTKLLLNQEKICFGVYPRKYSDDIEVIKLTRHLTDWITFKKDEMDGLNDVLEVRTVGFGCALIDIDVFKKLKYPYFKYEDFGGGDILSEDYYFCEMARNAGFQIFADFSVRCGHIGRFTKNI